MSELSTSDIQQRYNLIDKKKKELELLHSHKLLNIEGLSITQIKLLNSAIRALSLWVNIYSLKEKEIELDPTYQQYDIRGILSFLTQLETEISEALEFFVNDKNYSEFKKSFQMEKMGWNMAVLYYPESSFLNSYGVLVDFLIDKLTKHTFSNGLEDFFNSENFECLYDDEDLFKFDVLKCYFSIDLIQGARKGKNIADSMIKSTQLIDSLIINNTFTYEHEKNIAAQEKEAYEKFVIKEINIATRHIKGNEAKNKYPRLFAKKVKQLYQQSDKYPNKSQAVKAMIPELEKYSISDLKGYWPQAEDNEKAIYRLLIKK